MKFTLSWLKQHLETSSSLEEICNALTSLGLVVESVENLGEQLKAFKVCEIIKVEKHPNADRLQICYVKTEDDEIQVVCGDPKAKPGMKSVLARPGDVIPSTSQTLKKGKVRGIDSYGMLCAAEELGIGSKQNGIIEVNSDILIGTPYVELIKADDPLIEIEVTPNRGDCLGVHGIARDLAAKGLGKIKPLEKVNPVKAKLLSSIQIKLDLFQEEKKACPLFTGRIISGVKNGPSPEWLQRKLLSIGLSPVSALVDITNFFTIDRGRPLHVFDAGKIEGDLEISLSNGGENFQALDDKDYTLNSGMTVISDQSSVLSLGGVIGGKSSSCDENTVNVFLESAFFDPIRTAATGRELGIITDARYRFERGVDPETTFSGLEAATQMILEICGGEASEIVFKGEVPQHNNQVTLRYKRILTLGGVSLSQERIKEILTKLGFKITQEEAQKIKVEGPSWRFDVAQEVDLVEEVLRVEGYDSIPSMPFCAPSQGPIITLDQRCCYNIRDVFVGRGMSQVITWSFMSDKIAQNFRKINDQLILVNPISKDLNGMRPTIIPNLLDSAQCNANRGINDCAIFEVGPQYQDNTSSGQQLMATGIRCGQISRSNWRSQGRQVDLFDVKADIFEAFRSCGINPKNIQCEVGAPQWYHPGRSGALKQGSNVLAYFGEVHPSHIKNYGLSDPTVAFEIFISHFPKEKRKKIKPKLNLSAYQAVERDFAFVVECSVSSDLLVKTIKKVSPQIIRDVNVFDVFEDSSLGENRKSIGFRVCLQSQVHTLTEEELINISQNIIIEVREKTGGILRQ